MKKLYIFLLVGVVLAGVSCSKVTGPDDTGKTKMERLSVSPEFNWQTTRHARFSITALDNIGQPIQGAKFEIYTHNPDEGGTLITSGVTGQNGKYVVDYQVPAYYSKLYIKTDYLGLVNGREVDLGPDGFDVVYGGINPGVQTKEVMIPTATSAKYKFLGAYNSQGVPAYLEPQNDPITASFLDDVNKTLPERVRLDVSHPEYFLPQYDHNITLVETCDVWVTFVTEGAGYLNVLGFYTYPTNNPPATPAAIDTITIIFPNASLLNSGGGLRPGNKVKIGRFNAGTTIAFALIADGWKNGQVTDGRWTVYSDKHLNGPANPNLLQHTVLLRDPGRQLFLLGFEDIKRNQSGSDHDFNDAVFYITANPVQSIDPSKLPIVDYTGQDSDGDGIPNQFDDYPDDPARAFNNYFFSKGNFGTLAFEDLWPYRGDYDFNDAVIDYNFNQITNGANQVMEVQGIFILRAHGAFYHNGFGIELPVPSSSVQSVSGTRLSSNYIQLNANGTEANQPNAVVIVWDDSYNILPPVGTSIGANTTPEVPFIAPDTLLVNIVFKQPVPLSQLGIAPFNPFIIVNKQRGVEVHLPDKAPTALADPKLLGSGHDNSIPMQGRYYKTSNNLPWAINIVERFEYPIEKTEVIDAHLKFGEWAESGGSLFNDWFKDRQGYRNTSKIYKPTTR
ncbi:MAG TPA: LruC domain-containing protein [Bacteroidales bacterium]|nr:LruC domain-containing protein [Bacteroidales bacterium]